MPNFWPSPCMAQGQKYLATNNSFDVAHIHDFSTICVGFYFELFFAHIPEEGFWIFKLGLHYEVDLEVIWKCEDALAWIQKFKNETIHSSFAH